MNDVMIIAILLLFVIPNAHGDEFFQNNCLKVQLNLCKRGNVNKEHLTKGEKDIMMCRIRALVKCRKKYE